MFIRLITAACCLAVIVTVQGRALAQGETRAVASTHCAVFSNEKEKQVASDAVSAFGAPALRLDVGVAADLQTLARDCNGIVFAIGPKALAAAAKAPPTAKLLSALVSVPETVLPSRAVTASVLQDAAPEKAFSTLSLIAPRTRKVGVVFDPTKTGRLIAEARVVARSRGIELVALAVRNVGEAVRAFHRFEKEVPVDAIWLVPDGSATVQETVYYVLELAHWKRIPVLGLSQWYVANGALFALIPRADRLGQRTGELGRQVLDGVKTSTSYSRTDALIINERTATRLGLKIPDALRSVAEIVSP